MSRFLTSLLAAALLSVAFSSAGADEEKVPLDKVPKAVLDAVKAKFPGAELAGAEKETTNGKVVYELALKHKGQKMDVTLTPEGKVIEVEKQIAATDLPTAVAKVLEDKYPKATYKIIEEIHKEEKGELKLAYYEVLLVTADQKTVEVVLAPEGKIAKEEKKDKQ